ncbi:MAG: PIG-L family deacetylase [Propionibacterium sp.]|nr:PIG-L family deacetylase [Propionibacterium sp.]
MTSPLAPLYDGPLRRVLFVHAHPDDETLSTGALIAALAASGVECQLLTCTRGECGEIVPGVLPAGTTADGLTRWRLHELAGACAELGVARNGFLGTPPALGPGCAERTYRDSGMRWLTPTLAGPAADAGLDSLTGRPFEDAVSDVLAAVAAWRPDLLISYDLGGGYGHPDHVRTAEISLAVARAAALPLLQTVTGTPDAATWLDLADQLQPVRRALGHYRSQLTVDGDHVVHVGGQRQPIDTTVGLHRVGP